MTQMTARAASERSFQQLAQGLGWFSVALGVTELVAAESLCKFLGLAGKERLVQAYGARELLAGVGILANSNPAGWMWSRVAGDALDIATLFCAHGPGKWNAERAMALVTAVTVVDIACAQGLEANKAAQAERAERYRARVGLRSSPAAMRGKARVTKIPSDMRTPKVLRYAGSDAQSEPSTTM
jgi:hypothetical protein